MSSDARFLLSEGVLKMNVQEDWLDQFRDAESRFEEASELINRGKPDEALPMLVRLLEFNPYHSRTRLALAEALGDLGRAADALDELIEGLRIDPENGDFYCYALRYFPDSDQMAAAEERYARMAVELGTCSPC